MPSLSSGAPATVTQPVPFRVAVDDAILDDIRSRVARYRHVPPPCDEGDGWDYGVNSRWLKRLCDYWLSGYDWRAAEADLNRYPQFIATIDDVRLHYVTIRGEGTCRLPLVLLHGWPGSHFEFWKIADRLAFPSRHGGSANDAFDLVIISLPGYGFSGPALRPIGMRTAARLINRLMTAVLGFSRYMVQGGDWGSVVATWLGVDYPESCAAVHLNMIGIRPQVWDDGAATEAERTAIAEILARERPRLAYALQHGTRPQTLAVGLMDSPVGAAAWMLDKFQQWSDLREKTLDEVYSLDTLLTNVMIYLVNGTVASSLWSYYATAQERQPFGPELYCSPPTALARYPFEPVGATPPRSWVERYYNLIRWTDLDHGGHFAAMEAGDSLVQDITAFRRQIFTSIS